MQRVVINIGDKIEMTHVKSSMRRKVSDRLYNSQLLDYDGMRSARIAMPIYEGKVVPLEINDEYDLCFFTAVGLYRCRAKVVDRFREGKMYVLAMEFLSLPKKFQRRQFFRLDCMLEIRYRIISEEERTLRELIAASTFEEESVREAYESKLDEFSREWESAMMTDISGGGVRFQCRNEAVPGTFVEVALPLSVNDGIVSLKCMAKVVANVEITSGQNQSELRCEFENIEKDTRELIVKYVFEEQKRRLRKE